MKIYVLSAVLVLGASCAATAAPLLSCDNNGRCVAARTEVQERGAVSHRDHHRNAPARRHGRFRGDDDVTFLPHPRGCPRIAFCACGAAVEIFGRPIRALWAARAWFRFPRAAPAPGRVGVQRHHVIVLRQHVEGDRWLVYDANSGAHRTRLHVRSIAAFSIRDPRGA